jgi:hypothetical protein
MAEVHEHQAEVFRLRDALEAESDEALRFPFVLYAGRDVRAFQAYLTPFPEGLLDIFPRLRTEAAPPASHAPAPHDSGCGQPYQDVDTSASVARGAPISADPALVERALRGHRSTQNALAEFVRANGWNPLSPRADDPPFDLCWYVDDTIHVAEVKSVTDANMESQLRLGLGQILKYRHLVARRTGKPSRAVLVLEAKPQDDTWIELCRDLEVDLVWPPFLKASLS